MTDKPEDLRCVPCPKCGADMGWDNSEPEPCDVCRQQAEVARLRGLLKEARGFIGEGDDVETHLWAVRAAAALEGKDDDEQLRRDMEDYGPETAGDA